jgi:hypothetical protein
LTGALLFAPRATAASANGIFQIKMGLLVGAAVFHAVVHRRLAQSATSSSMRRGTAAVGLLLWLGLALAGCAYILLE